MLFRTDAWHRRAKVLCSIMAIAGPLVAQVPFVLNDTTFLERTNAPYGYHAVYIAAEEDSVWYERLAGPVGDMEKERWVRLQLKMLDELGKVPKPPPMEGIERDWVAVKRLDGAYHLYAPSDWGYHRRMQIGSKAIVTSEMDGPLAHVFVGGDGWRDGRFHARCVSLVSRSMDVKHDTVDVIGYPLPNDEPIFLWEFRDSAWDSTFELMVPIEYARRYPVLVNHSPWRKQLHEFIFEPEGRQMLVR